MSRPSSAHPMTPQGADMTRNPIDENWDEGLAGIREMSDKLKGLVSTLVAEGWTEEQARELIVAAFVSNARGVR